MDSQAFKEAPPRAHAVAQLAPQAPQAVRHGVQLERQQVERREQVRQAVLAMPEVVLEVLAVPAEITDPVSYFLKTRKSFRSGS